MWVSSALCGFSKAFNSILITENRGNPNQVWKGRERELLKVTRFGIQGSEWDQQSGVISMQNLRCPLEGHPHVLYFGVPHPRPDPQGQREHMAKVCARGSIQRARNVYQ